MEKYKRLKFQNNDGVLSGGGFKSLLVLMKYDEADVARTFALDFIINRMIVRDFTEVIVFECGVDEPAVLKELGIQVVEGDYTELLLIGNPISDDNSRGFITGVAKGLKMDVLNADFKGIPLGYELPSERIKRIKKHFVEAKVFSTETELFFDLPNQKAVKRK